MTAELLAVGGAVGIFVAGFGLGGMHATQRRADWSRATGSANRERRRAVHRIYATAASSQEPDATGAVLTLRAIALNAYDPSLGRAQCNPGTTRLYALVALGWLSLRDQRDAHIPESVADVFPGEGQ